MTAVVGIRERRKAQKLTAIRKAARKLFMTHGFHETPLREVARVADVGFGTVSVYATDKAGLAAMLFVEDLQKLPPLFEADPTDAPLLDQIMDNFNVSFRFWARMPELSRIVLPMLDNNVNPYVEFIMKRRATLRASLIQWLARFKRAGKMKRSINEEQAAELLFSLYIATLNEWLSANINDVEAGLRRMRYLLEIPVGAIER